LSEQEACGTHVLVVGVVVSKEHSVDIVPLFGEANGLKTLALQIHGKEISSLLCTRKANGQQIGATNNMLIFLFRKRP
jgi:hypothetical protein